MLNTNQAAALHAFNNSASQGRLTETSLARALKSEKALARNVITVLREKGMITQAGKYEFRITDAGKKHLKCITAANSAVLNKALSPVTSKQQKQSAVIAASAAVGAKTAQPEAPAAADQSDESIDVDQELAELQQQGIIQQAGDRIEITNKGEQCVIETELSNLAEILDPDHLPVIDDIDVKQHALAGISLLLKNRTPALAKIIDEVSVDLSVVRLHQERRA